MTLVKLGPDESVLEALVYAPRPVNLILVNHTQSTEIFSRSSSWPCSSVHGFVGCKQPFRWYSPFAIPSSAQHGTSLQNK